MEKSAKEHLREMLQHGNIDECTYEHIMAILRSHKLDHNMLEDAIRDLEFSYNHGGHAANHEHHGHDIHGHDLHNHSVHGGSHDHHVHSPNIHGHDPHHNNHHV